MNGGLATNQRQCCEKYSSSSEEVAISVQVINDLVYELLCKLEYFSKQLTSERLD